MSVGITSVDRGGVEVYKCEYETASFTYARMHACTHPQVEEASRA